MGVSREYGRIVSEGPTPADVAGAPALPYPSGWSALAFSHELRPGAVLTRTLAGQDVVLYRTATGVLRAVRPYCPHLGAHLGLAKVEGEDLTCPFHFFSFGPDGACVRTGYGTPPPRSPLTQLPVHEVNGGVFVWRHHDGRGPDWSVPQWHEIGHRPARTAAWELAGNVQEVIENAVDLGHFATLHGWAKAEIDGPVVYDGAEFRVSMRAHESAPLVGDFTVDAQVHGHGLGCLHADVHTPRFGLRMCTMVMPTAVGPNRMQFRQLNRIAFDEPSRLPPRSARLVSRVAARLLDRPVFRSSCEFTAADFPIWHHKQYQQPPRLASGDGPIGPFRRWAKRFYPETPGRTSVPRPHRGEGEDGAVLP
ncbi:Rieske 2Fe-2S domain-containing protein [Streptomyces sp. TRM75563]|uniref:Rieske 2Fe-2S domain-containing protein n=1 Tax=Streptomyces sp. TRM75563 TaxID=2817418 RepID=UPI001F61391E|nr:Rieske 2Fe-2S domain-containing protein [Streptomyces sp. TRM75563]MCI4042020.1 Rieske 2Fe-2S domain-containing protein [Streptomyces sp. TRM75563]